MPEFARDGILHSSILAVERMLDKAGPEVLREKVAVFSTAAADVARWRYSLIFVRISLKVLVIFKKCGKVGFRGPP